MTVDEMTVGEMTCRWNDCRWNDCLWNECRRNGCRWNQLSAKWLSVKWLSMKWLSMKWPVGEMILSVKLLSAKYNVCEVIVDVMIRTPLEIIISLFHLTLSCWLRKLFNVRLESWPRLGVVIKTSCSTANDVLVAKLLSFVTNCHIHNCQCSNNFVCLYMQWVNIVMMLWLWLPYDFNLTYMSVWNGYKFQTTYQICPF